MAFYYKLNGQVYKSARKVTIGRGAPFESLNEFRDISRKHCKLIKKKDSFYIKRLDEKAKVLVNGKNLPLRKLVKVSANDSIYLADLEIKLLSNYTGKDYITINRFYSPITKASKLGFFSSWGLITLLFFLFFLFRSDDFRIAVLLFKFLTSLLIGFIFALQTKFLAKFAGRKDEVMVNEVVVGDSGLTLHYLKENMSILYTDISMIYKKLGVIYIHAHDEEFALSNIHNADKLYAKIVKHIPQSILTQNNKSSDTLVRVFVFLAFAFSAIFIKYFTQLWSKEALIMTCWGIITVILALFWKNMMSYNSKNMNLMKRHKKLLALSLLSIVYVYGTEFMAVNRIQKKFNECIEGVEKSCQQVSLDELESGYGYESDEFLAVKDIICKAKPEICERHKKLSSKAAARNIGSIKK